MYGSTMRRPSPFRLDTAPATSAHMSRRIIRSYMVRATTTVLGSAASGMATPSHGALASAIGIRGGIRGRGGGPDGRFDPYRVSIPGGDLGTGSSSRRVR